MNSFRTLKVLLLLLLGNVSLTGQHTGFVRKVSDTVIVTEGSGLKLLIHFEVKAGFNIQSHDPVNKNVIASSLDLNLPQSCRTVKVTFPKATSKYLEGSSEPLEVIGGRFKIIADLECPNILPEISQITGSLYYQACDDKRCFYPRQLEFKLHQVGAR